MNLSLTRDAVQHLSKESGGRMLRIAFTTGCGGSGYRLSFADAPNEGDHVTRIEGIDVALDGMALSQLDGAVIRYEPEEDGYLLDHPNAVTTVWCG